MVSEQQRDLGMAEIRSKSNEDHLKMLDRKLLDLGVVAKSWEEKLKVVCTKQDRMEQIMEEINRNHELMISMLTKMIAKSAPKGEFRMLENWPTIEERKSEVEITIAELNGVLQLMCIESSLARVGSNEIKSGQSLFQQKNIVSISSRMKNLGNEEQKLLTRVLEDPIELEQIQGIKMTFNTTEERRKEIELSVTAARLLQQKSEYLQVGEVRILPGTLKEHLGILSPKFQLVIPDRVENECVEILLSCSWKTMDPNAAITMLEER